ncbi:glycosyltransferase [uncultured Pseudodesulfovibrio sp.]|uniref:glycosyltransferase n=1 Tax=uncultured Pseudodesulfovibrio sp. TaxID=2035858 RepID=UPI0029C6F2B4|nr:glycosyltransferase [uncultured Pseudodesulfovibrio sp.]
MLISDLWLVIPCFNEETRLDVDAFLEFLSGAPDARLCFVNDGSTDGTGAVLSGIQKQYPDNISVQTLPANQGKAEAVRVGILHGLAHSDKGCVGYWDADLASPFNQLKLFDAEADSGDWRLLMGCRHQRLGTDIRRKAGRHYLGRCFATLVSQLLKLPVYDTQCGAKIFRTDAARVLFAQPFLSPWVFDVEILARFIEAFGKRAVMESIREVPLSQWHDVNGSKLSFAACANSMADLCRIKRTYNL